MGGMFWGQLSRPRHLQFINRFSLDIVMIVYDVMNIWTSCSCTVYFADKTKSEIIECATLIDNLLFLKSFLCGFNSSVGN